MKRKMTRAVSRDFGLYEMCQEMYRMQHTNKKDHQFWNFPKGGLQMVFRQMPAQMDSEKEHDEQ